MQGPKLMLAHQPCDAVLTAPFAGLAKVQEDSRGTVDALARREGRANQTKQSGVLLGMV